ncbi:methyl-accepting chemotaxis protein [Sodalis sp. C49]|uniref:methyl-accepting chemotaxis protein n=1 Tax=unclassified Sodalis (in: enterobacteria) TaxID=2636512 RepID=UPI003965938E
MLVIGQGGFKGRRWRLPRIDAPQWMTSLRGGFVLFLLLFCLLQCLSIALLSQLVTHMKSNITTAHAMTERQALMNKSRIELLTASDNINRAGVYFMQDKQSGSVGSWQALADSADTALKAAQSFFADYQKLDGAQDNDAALRQNFALVFDGLNEQLKGLRADNIDSFFMVPIQAFQEQFNTAFYQRLSQDTAEAGRFNQAILSSLTTGRSLSLGISVLLAGLLALAGLALSYAVIMPLDHALRHMAQIATGNLSEPMTASRWQSREIVDLNQGIGQMQLGLQHIVNEINEISSLVMQGAGDIASHNQRVSQHNRHQTQAFQTIGERLNHVAQEAETGAQFAGNATRHMSDAEALTRRCGEMVTEVDKKMHEIVAESEKIAGIVTFLDGISMQTKLLSLNAAIEAAHSGINGRTFSVVAREMSLLSQKSGGSTRDIDMLIQSTHRHIDSGFSRVKALDRVYHDIVQAVQGVALLLDELQRNAASQSEGVNTIAGEIKQLNDQIAQSNLLTLACAKASDALIGHSQRLRQSVSKFALA